MNLLQAEFKSLKDNNIEDWQDYILTDGNSFVVASSCRGFWYPSNIDEIGWEKGLELRFTPTHFAEIKIEETK